MITFLIIAFLNLESICPISMRFFVDIDPLAKQNILPVCVVPILLQVFEIWAVEIS